MGPGDRVRPADKMDHKVLSCFMAILRAGTLRNLDSSFHITGGKSRAHRSAPDYHAGMELGLYSCTAYDWEAEMKTSVTLLDLLSIRSLESGSGRKVQPM